MKSNKGQARYRIAVVGGGVIGVTSALALQEEFHGQIEEISIYSDRWSPYTTGDVSAGLIYPYLPGKETPRCLLERVFADTMKYYERLIREPDSGKFGVSLLTLYELYQSATNDQPKPVGVQCFPMFRELHSKELSMFPSQYQSGIAVTSYIAEPSLLLPKLMEQFKAQGGHLVTEKIQSLTSLTGQYDLVVNCTGLGSRFLADVQDNQVEPVRGQVIRVRAPWVRHAVMTDEFYILPNRDCVILGGTKQKGNFDLRADPATTQRIWSNCCKLVPSLKHAAKVGDFVGLRPYRAALRIEHDPRSKRILHNYGHGGSGVTLCWGSALEVVRLARQSLSVGSGRYIQSKL